MKKSIILLIFASFCIALVSCGNSSFEKTVSKELGIDAKGGRVISNEDTHGGFQGDGETFISIEYDNKALEEEIKANPAWKALPLDKTSEALIYGTENEDGCIGPFLSDEEGHPLIPKIEKGYYILIDRQSEKEGDILERYSFNFTFSIYDSHNDMLYFCKFDT